MIRSPVKGYRFSLIFRFANIILLELNVNFAKKDFTAMRSLVPPRTVSSALVLVLNRLIISVLLACLKAVPRKNTSVINVYWAMTEITARS